MTYPPLLGGIFSCVVYHSFMSSVDSVYSMLDERAARYGGTVADMLDITPVSLWDSPTELTTFWDQRDLSHVFPQSTYTWMSDDWGNIIPESPSVNRARGADIMSQTEIIDAQLDNELLAMDIDTMTFDDSPEFMGELMDVVFV